VRFLKISRRLPCRAIRPLPRWMRHVQTLSFALENRFKGCASTVRNDYGLPQEQQAGSA